MPDNETSRSKNGASIDFAALEVEIDREIDSVFIPTVQRSARIRTGDAPTDPSLIYLDAAEGISTKKLQTDVNLDDLQTKVDEEIDSVFVPTVQRQERIRNKGEIHNRSLNGLDGKKNISMDAPETRANLDDLRVMIDEEIDSVIVPKAQKNGETEKQIQELSSMDTDCKEAEPTGETKTNVNLDALRTLIDYEIDSVFVPCSKPDRQAEPVLVENRLDLETETIKNETLARPAQTGLPVQKESDLSAKPSVQ